MEIQEKDGKNIFQGPGVVKTFVVHAIFLF